jgi:hypothetical protein
MYHTYFLSLHILNKFKKIVQNIGEKLNSHIIVYFR